MIELSPNPHSVLGAHPTLDGRTVIRTLRPEASAVTALTGGTRVPLQRLPHGVFGGIVANAPGIGSILGVVIEGLVVGGVRMAVACAMCSS